jgi:molybdopterin-binding protein
MTRDSFEDAGFSKGDKVHALVKAINLVFVKQ